MKTEIFEFTGYSGAVLPAVVWRQLVLTYAVHGTLCSTRKPTVLLKRPGLA